MKYTACILLLLMIAAPAFSQELDEHQLPPGAQFALGNLALNDLVRSSGPLQELKSFFFDSNLPLTKAQERSLEALFQAHQKEMNAERDRSDAPSAETARRLNQEYLKRINGVLTPEQQNAWRHYRVEQIRLRGGYPALQFILEQAGAPLSAEQQKSIQQIFDNFDKRRARLSEANATPAVAELDRLSIAELDRVVGLLTPEQRKALQASRRTGRSSVARR